MIDQQNIVKELSSPLYQARGWMKFIGVMMIIGGILYAITIIGIIVAWVPIWMGVILFQAGNSSEQAFISGEKFSFLKSMTQLKLYFTITGIMMLIGLIIMFIGLIVMIVTGFAFMDAFDRGGYY